MTNSWLNIPLEDYEGHMSFAGIEQAQLLAGVLGECIEQYAPDEIAVIGCSGGNGFENIPSRVTRVVGVDINADYIAKTKERFEREFKNLELLAGDIQNE